MTEKPFDDFHLSRLERRSLMDKLADIPWIANELDTVIVRDTKYHDTPERPGTGDANPFHLAASDIAWELRDCLRTWTNEIATGRQLHWPGELRAGDYARWIHHHLIDLAQIEHAASAADEITDLHRRCLAMIDRPRDLEFVGPCQSDIDGVTCDGVYATRGADTKTCRDCQVCIDVVAVQETTKAVVEDRLYQSRELATALTIVTGEKVPFERVRNWIRRGKLEAATTAGAPLYKLQDARRLTEKPHRRRTA